MERIEKVLSDWNPGRTQDEAEAFRSIGVRAIEWLHELDAPAEKSAFVDELYEETAPEDMDADAWWRRIIRPALREGRKAGVIEYKHGGRHRYRWVGGRPELRDFKWVEKD